MFRSLEPSLNDTGAGLTTRLRSEAEPGAEVRPAGRFSPWWAWLVPAAFFLLCLFIHWPRPYMIPSKGDALRYYGGAMQIAEHGRYYEDIYQRPAQPITSNAPLFAMIWGGSIYFGIPPITALAGIHAIFLFALGATGGALSYHVTRSWVGPFVWTILSCCWPGGSHWLMWVRPLTESGTTAMFVIVAWMCACALRADRPKDAAWLLAAATVAGLSMIMKVTGVCSLPVVGVVSLIVMRRRSGWFRWWLPVATTLLMTLWYATWCVRNLSLIGQIESHKPTHSIELLWDLMRTTSAGVARWFLPSEAAATLAQALHPAVIMAPIIIVPVVLCWLAWKQQAREALLAGSIGAMTFLVLGISMTRQLTEEPRYWATMIPCLAVVVLILRPPRSLLMGQVFRVGVALFLMFCCARFAVANRTLWYGTQIGFYARLLFLTACLVGGIGYIHQEIRRFWGHDRVLRAHMFAVVACGVLAIGWWRYVTEPKPLWVLLPLAGVGLILSMPLDLRHAMIPLRQALIVSTVLVTIWLGNWSVSDLHRPDAFAYRWRGVQVRAPQSAIDAREWFRQNHDYRFYTSNAPEHFSDLAEGLQTIPLPLCASYVRFRAGLAQLPDDEALAKQLWLDQLREAGVDEPFVMVYFPQAEHRACYFGPKDFASLPGIDVSSIIDRDDLQIARCRLTRR